MNLSDVAKGIQISEAPQCSNEVGGTLRVWGGGTLRVWRGTLKVWGVLWECEGAL